MLPQAVNGRLVSITFRRSPSGVGPIPEIPSPPNPGRHLAAAACQPDEAEIIGHFVKNSACDERANFRVTPLLGESLL